MGNDNQQKGEVQNFGNEWRQPYPDLPKKHSEEYAWSEYCNNFEKSERERVYFLSKQKIYSM